MLYLATWENETKVIGMVEVLKHKGDESMPPREFILCAKDLKDRVAARECFKLNKEQQSMIRELLQKSRREELPEQVPFGEKSFNFRGLVFDDVVTSRQYRRRGIAKALFCAIERDAYELVERMEKCGGKHCGPNDERIRLEVVSAPTKAALGFYRSIGFQFKSWQDDRVKKEQNYLQRLKDRLKWTWHWVNPKLHGPNLVKIVGNSTCSRNP